MHPPADAAVDFVGRAVLGRDGEALVEPHAQLPQNAVALVLGEERLQRLGRRRGAGVSGRSARISPSTTSAASGAERSPLMPRYAASWAAAAARAGPSWTIGSPRNVRLPLSASRPSGSNVMMFAGSTLISPDGTICCSPQSTKPSCAFHP